MAVKKTFFDLTLAEVNLARFLFHFFTQVFHDYC